MKTNYPSRLTDTEWLCLQQFLPPRSPQGKLRRHSLRRVFYALFYLLRTWCPWRCLREERRISPATRSTLLQAMAQDLSLPPAAKGVLWSRKPWSTLLGGCHGIGLAAQSTFSASVEAHARRSSSVFPRDLFCQRRLSSREVSTSLPITHP